MKKLLTIVAFLCASMVGWATEWTGQVTGSATNVWLDGIGSNEDRTTVNYAVNYQVGYSSGTLTITIGYTDDNFNKTVGLVPQVFVNNGYVGNFSANSWSSTAYSEGDALSIYFYFAYNGGASASSSFNYTVSSDAGGGDDPEPGSGSDDPEPTEIDWSTISWVANSSNKYKVAAVSGMNVVEVQQPGFAAERGIYMTFPSDIGLSCSLGSGKYATQGAGMVIYLSAFVRQVTDVTVTSNGNDYDFAVYYADGIFDSEYCAEVMLAGDNREAAFTWETDDDGNVIISISETLGGADNATYFRGNGITADKIKIGEGRDAITTYFTHPGDIAGQQTLTLTLTDPSNKPAIGTKIYVENQIIEYATSKDGNAWPNLTFEYTYGGKCIADPVLTKINLSASSIFAKVGENVTLTAIGKDQMNQDFDAVISYSISPNDAGSIVGNVYTPAKLGDAVITATSGEVSNSISIHCVPSDNLILNKTCEAGYEDGNPAETAAKVNDGNINTAWVTYADRPASEEWWYVDLEDNYDLTAVDVLWGADYSTNYIIQVRDDAPSNDDKSADDAWTTLATVTTASANSEIYTPLSGSGRYVRMHSLSRSGNCIRLRELRLFGAVKATATKAVSASANDAEMGSATVKQNGVAVTEVETGSEVTFSAVPNDGYVFTGWSNDESRATFTTTVNSTMNLTANFRAIKTVYCMTEMEKSSHTIYVTMKRSAASTYQLIVRSNEQLQGFGNAYFYRPNNIQIGNISQMQELSDNNHTLTATMTAATEPYMTTPLYVVISGVGEVAFDKLTDIEYEVECDDNASVTSVTISRTTASVAVGDEFDLTAQVVPAFATNKTITWSSDNTSVATVSSAGHVTTKAEGTAHIIATSADGGYTATCTVTVNTELETQTYWGNGSKNGIAIAYNIMRNSDYTLTYVLEALHQKTGFVPEVNYPDEPNAYHSMSYDNESQTYSHTTTLTYSDGDVINGFFWLKYEGGVVGIDFAYTVGASSEKEAYIPITLDANTDDASWIEANDGETRDVEIVRPMTADTYFKTICFPFSMTAEQVAETFGSCEILRLAEARMKSETEMYIRYAPVSTIEAGYPYLITLLGAENLSKLDFTGVTINSSTLNNTITVDAGDGKGLEMIGTFVNISCDDNDEFYLDATDNLLHSIGAYCSEQSVASLTIPAFRCYFRLTGFSNPAGVCARVGRSPYVATGTEETQSSAAPTKQIRDGQLLILRDGKYYTVTGVVVK